LKILIAFLKGKVERIGQDFIDVDVNGVGYRTFTSISTIEKVKQGESVKVFTYLSVREDALILYGFISEEELELFEKLIMVSGVGPKAALAILSAMPPSTFCHYVANEKIDRLMKVPGIGRKTGQRIILELKDKLADLTGEYESFEVSDNKKEALEALTSLGFNPGQVKLVLAEIDETGIDTARLIKMCLAKLKS
jgi:Holliday junction DNA helicase RuvA